MNEVILMSNQQSNQILEAIKIILELTQDAELITEYITRIQQAK